MKCIACSNELPSTKRWIQSGKMACQLHGCSSYGLKPGSKAFRIQVMGRDPAAVEEAWKQRGQKSVRTKRDSGFFEDLSTNPYSAAFWAKKGLSEEQVREQLSKKAKRSVHTKRTNGWFADPANNAFSIEFGIQKKGMSVEESQNRIKRKNHNCAEYWVERGFSEEEAIQKSKISADTISLRAKQLRYGLEEGLRSYNMTSEKMSASWNPASSAGRNFSSSLQADRFFTKLYKFARRLGYRRDDFMMNMNKGEFWIRNTEGLFFYDFVLRPLKLIIEFNGEHVHPNRSMLDLEWSTWRHAYTKVTADETYKYDKRKEQIAQEAGYNVLTVWSKDQQNLSIAKNFIKEHHEYQSH